MIWVFLNAYIISPFLIISLILTTLKNGKHTYRRVRVNDCSASENSTDITNVIVDEFIIYIETNSGDAS